METFDVVKAMSVLTLREGDVLVVKTGSRLNDSFRRGIIGLVEENLPQNIRGKVKVFVLEEGMDIGVLRAEAR